MNNDLISRSALKAEVEKMEFDYGLEFEFRKGVLDLIDNAPTVTERPQIIGCFNCKHEKKMSIEEPCRYCNVKYSKWEEKGGAE